MWLHHVSEKYSRVVFCANVLQMVAFTVGPKRMDPTCIGKMSLPHMLMNSDASKSERFFSVGNEKTPSSFNPPWVKNETLGYHIYDSDKFSFIVDLMNQNKEDKTVYMTLTYDYIEGRPKGIDNIRVCYLAKHISPR
jgi:hypothetical protein